MTVHLMIVDEIACGSAAAKPKVTKDIDEYSCTRCGARLVEYPQLVNMLAQKNARSAMDVPVKLRRKPVREATS